MKKTVSILVAVMAMIVVLSSCNQHQSRTIVVDQITAPDGSTITVTYPSQDAFNGAQYSNDQSQNSRLDAVENRLDKVEKDVDDLKKSANDIVDNYKKLKAEVVKNGKNIGWAHSKINRHTNDTTGIHNVIDPCAN